VRSGLHGKLLVNSETIKRQNDKMKSTKTDIQFFHDQAGWSYDPAKETREQGRMRGARALAKAEAEAKTAGYSFEWSLDGGDSSEWTKSRKPATPTWQCLCRDTAGKVCGSLCGIDFVDKEPWGQPYKRVVEAELALEAGA
jgi:hypothetical protein